MLGRTTGIVLCGIAIGTFGLFSAQAADTKASEIKDGISGKIVKVDVEKGSVTIASEEGRERTFSITDQTVIVGPRGGTVHKRLKDPRFHQGHSIIVVANGTTAAQLHLGYNRKMRDRTATSSSSAPATSSPSTPENGTTATDGAPTTAPKTRTARFRGLIDSKTATTKSAAKSEEADDEDNDFPGKVKSVDSAKRMLVITLLNGKDRSFLLASDVKVTVNGHVSRHGLSDTAIKPGIPLTVVTEAGSRKVKEVKVLSAAARRAKKAS
jgi:hypothetical protein